MTPCKFVTPYRLGSEWMIWYICGWGRTHSTQRLLWPRHKEAPRVSLTEGSSVEDCEDISSMKELLMRLQEVHSTYIWVGLSHYGTNQAYWSSTPSVSLAQYTSRFCVSTLYREHQRLSKILKKDRLALERVCWILVSCFDAQSCAHEEGCENWEKMPHQSGHNLIEKQTPWPVTLDCWW